MGLRFAKRIWNYKSVCVYTYIYIRTHIYTYIYTYIHIHIYVYTHVYMYTHAYVCVYICTHVHMLHGFPCSSVGKESACSAGDPGLIPGLGRSPGEGNGNPLQYPCLKNLMDRGAWGHAVHGVIKSWARLSDQHLLTYMHIYFPLRCWQRLINLKQVVNSGFTRLNRIII